MSTAYVAWPAMRLASPTAAPPANSRPRRRVVRKVPAAEPSAMPLITPTQPAPEAPPVAHAPSVPATARRLDDWFAASARRLRASPLGENLHAGGTWPRQAAPHFVVKTHTPTSAAPAERSAPTVRPIRPDDWFSVEARVLRHRPRVAPRSPQAPSRRPKSARTRHDPAEWMAAEIRRLALSADEAAALLGCARNRAATGLLWLVAYAAAGRSIRVAGLPATGSRTTTTLACDDLVQEGAAALLHALDRWDPERGSITTYAYLRAKFAMMRAIENQSRAIRIPVHAQEKLRRLYAAQARLEDRERRRGSASGRSSVASGKAERDGGEVGNLQQPITLTRVAAAARVSVREASMLLVRAKNVLSIDAPLSGMPTITLHDVLVDERMNVADSVEHRAMSESLSDLVRGHPGLDDRERNVIMLRYGLHDGGTFVVAREVAEQLGISLYKVRIAERSALAKLRADLRGLERDAYLEWLGSHD